MKYILTILLFFIAISSNSQIYGLDREEYVYPERRKLYSPDNTFKFRFPLCHKDYYEEWCEKYQNYVKKLINSVPKWYKEQKIPFGAKVNLFGGGCGSANPYCWYKYNGKDNFIGFEYLEFPDWYKPEEHIFYSLEEAMKEPEKVVGLRLVHACNFHFTKVLLDEIPKFKNLVFINVSVDFDYEQHFKRLYNNLKELPDLQYINFKRRGQFRFPVNDLSCFKNLRIIHQPNNNEEFFKSLAQLPKLKCISINYNNNNAYNIKTPVNYANLNSLEKLILFTYPTEVHNCQYSLLCIDNNPNLQELYIYNMPDLEELPESIGNLENLNCLVIKKVKLKSLPESIGNLENLQELKIHGTSIQNIPETIGNLKKLSRLEILESELIEIPESICNLSNLKVLKIQSNLTGNLNENEKAIIKLPEKIGNLTNLTYLEITRTGITCLPESIGELENLKELKIEYAPLKSLPETIGNLKNLKKLEIKLTLLTSLPESIGNLENLTTLLINGKKIEIPETLSKLEKLRSLRIVATLEDFPSVITQIKNISRVDLHIPSCKKLPDGVEKLDTLFLYNVEKLIDISALNSLDHPLYLKIYSKYKNGRFKFNKYKARGS